MALPQLPPTQSLDSRVGRDFLNALRINFVEVDTTSAPQTVDLAKQTGPVIVVVDVGGNAGSNAITVTGTVSGVVNPTISTNYGVLRIVALKKQWFQW